MTEVAEPPHFAPQQPEAPAPPVASRVEEAPPAAPAVQQAVNPPEVPTLPAPPPAAPRPAPARLLPPRPYRDGPLTIDDFAGQPPEDRQGLLAYTYSGIDYNYKYRKSVTPGGVRLTLAEATVVSRVHPSKSWNLDPGNESLLKHEQGHFDMSEIYATRWRRVLENHIAKADLAAEGPDEASANAKLDAAINREFRPLLDALLKDQARYDDETNHGLDTARQAEWNAWFRQHLGQ